MAKPTQRGRTRKSGIFIVGISSLVLVAAAATVLAVFGWTKIRSVFAHDQVDTHQGKVAVVLAPVNIPAFTRLDVTMFINPRTGTLDIAWVDEKLVKECKAAAKKAGVDDKVEFRKGNVLEVEDLSDATVVLLYMGEDINLRLRPILQKTLKPGARVVSHRFTMGDWEPTQKKTVDSTVGYPCDVLLWEIKGKKE